VFILTDNASHGRSNLPRGLLSPRCVGNVRQLPVVIRMVAVMFQKAIDADDQFFFC
jgi:transcriptional regulator with AAA-type ATPase domain